MREARGWNPRALSKEHHLSPRRLAPTGAVGNYPDGSRPTPPPEPEAEAERAFVAWTEDRRDGIAHDHDPRVIVAATAELAATIYAAGQYGTAADDMRDLVRVAPIVGWAA